MKIAHLLRQVGRSRSTARCLFVIGAPRAGQAQLARVLAQAEHTKLTSSASQQRLEALLATEYPHSDRRDALTATPVLVAQFQQLVQHNPRGWVVDYTGANALRVPFLAAAFPEARFVYLARNPAEQIARMIGAWHTGHFVTYPQLPNWDGSWSLPLIPGWEALKGHSTAQIALTQWATITTTALDDLAELAPERWHMLDYAALCADPRATLHRLSQFTGLRWRHASRVVEVLKPRQQSNPADLAATHSLLPLVDLAVRQLQLTLDKRDLQRPLAGRQVVFFLPPRLRRTIATGSLAAALLGSQLLPAQVAQAASFEVTNLDDSGPGSLRDAIESANETPAADVITFQTGLSGAITLTTGQLEINTSLDIQGPGAAVISVSGNDTSRVFYLYSSTENIAVNISGLTITAGNAEDGGGIVNFDEDLILDGVTISGNTASNNGGGLWADGFEMDLTIRNSIISGNTAGNDGGGINVDYSGGPLLIQDSQITGNTANDSGGGIYFYNTRDAVTIERSTISGNTANGAGGGIYLYDTDGGPFTIRETTISGNQAIAGGGLFLYGPDHPVVIENSTISGNQASFAGGGIYLYDFDNVTIRHTTIAANSAYVGGGLFSYSTPTISHSIIGDNSAIIDPDVSFYGSGPVRTAVHKPTITGKTKVKEPRTPRPQGLPMSPITYSLIENTGMQPLFVDPFGNIINEDPQLGPLQNNGGPTQTHLPAATSPVLNAGNPAIVGAPTIDQRGQARIDAGTIDIGAVEFTPGSVSFTLDTLSVGEELPGATLTVTRTGGTDGAAAVSFATSAGTAIAGQDFTATNGTLTWADGDGMAQTIIIPIVDDLVDEPSETLTVALSNPQGTQLGSTTLATVTIVDNDVTYNAFLPSVINNQQPDLVVSSIVLTPGKTSFTAGEPVEITVTITNQGTAVTQPFWVDLYLNPAEEPSVNQTWYLICGLTPCYGIAWGALLPLQPGQSVTLRSTIDSYALGYTDWRGAFASGTNRIVVLADSYNQGSAIGAVTESIETNNSASLNVSVTGNNPPSLNSLPERSDIPARPMVPGSNK
jgi:parallel beta-helix repeat protein